MINATPGTNSGVYSGVGPRSLTSNIITSLSLDDTDGNPKSDLSVDSLMVELGTTGLIFEADPTTDLLSAYQYDGSSFTQVGNSFDTTTLTATSTEIDQVDVSDHVFKISDNVVGLCNHSSNNFSFYSWDGTDFTFLNYTSITDTSGNAMTWYLEDNVVAVFSGGSAVPSEVAIYDINTSTPSMTKRGNGWTGFTGTDVAVYGLGPNRIAVIDYYTSGGAVAELVTLDHDGTDFSETGSRLTMTVAMNNPYKGTVWDNNTLLLWQNGTVEPYTFNGSTWSVEGTGVDTGFSTASSVRRPRSIVKLSNSLVAARSRLGTGVIKAIAVQ